MRLSLPTFVAAAALLLASCQNQDGANAGNMAAQDAASGPVLPVTDDGSPSPDDGEQPASSDCSILGSSGWQAWVNAMPGPGARPTLIVEGTVRMPSAGHRASLALGEVAESDPLQVTVRLNTTAPSQPSAQVVTSVDVRGEWDVQGDVGSVTVRCAEQTVARIDSVETAR